MTIIERFKLSRDFGWRLDEKEFAEAIMALADNGTNDVYLVLNSTGQFLINKSYIKSVKVNKREGSE